MIDDLPPLPRAWRMPEELAAAFHADPTARSWLIHMPAHWGLDTLSAALAGTGPVAEVDGAFGPVPSEILPSGAAAPAADHAEPRTVMVLRPQHLATEEMDLLLREGARSDCRLLIVVRSPHERPAHIMELEHAGRLHSIAPSPMSRRDLGHRLRERLGGPHSARLAQRLDRASAGHPVLIDDLLSRGRRCGAVRQQAGVWDWPGDEAIHTVLGPAAETLLSGFDVDERDLLSLIGAAGWLPESHLIASPRRTALESLLAQGVVSTGRSAEPGHRDLRITATIVRAAVLAQMRHAEYLDQWYSEGRLIDAGQGGTRARTSWHWWRLRVEGRLDAESAEELARGALDCARYRAASAAVDSTASPSAGLLVLGARADHLLGDVDQALGRLETLPDDADDAAVRDAVLVAERISLFHPEPAAPVVASLRGRVEETSLTPLLDRIRADLRSDHPTEALLRSASMLRSAPERDEALLALLWAGTVAGFRHRVAVGGELLSTLLDISRREGGAPDVEECASAMLQLLRGLSDWTLEMVEIEADSLTGEDPPGPGLTALTDTLLALAALRDDRPHLAACHADAAVRAHADGDPFGLAPLARGLTALTTSLSAEPRRNPTGARRGGPDSMPAPDGASSGLPWIRRLVEALRLDEGSGAQEASSRWQTLLDEAVRAGESVSAQLIHLLLAVAAASTRSTPPAHAPQGFDQGFDQGSAAAPQLLRVLSARSRTEDPERVLDAAQQLLDARSRVLGLTVLAQLWTRRAGLESATRIRLLTMVLDARRDADDESLIFRRTLRLRFDQRDVAVLDALCRGRTTAQIARQMHLSRRTVESAISGMLRRTGCRNRMELLALNPSSTR